MTQPLLKENDISVIAIDLDDTLWNNKPALDYAEQRLYEWLKNNVPKITRSFSITDFKNHRISITEKNPYLRHDMTMQRLKSLSMLFEAEGYELKLAKEAMSVFLQARNNVTLYPDVVPVLKELYKVYGLVAVTNGNANIKRIGIDKYFEFSVSPSDTGTSKPDPMVFEFIMKSMNITPEMLVHIGDKPATDILGAQNAGIRNIWLNRNKTEWPSEHPIPDVEIFNLYDLIPTIKTFN